MKNLLLIAALILANVIFAFAIVETRFSVFQDDVTFQGCPRVEGAFDIKTALKFGPDYVAHEQPTDSRFHYDPKQGVLDPTVWVQVCEPKKGELPLVYHETFRFDGANGGVMATGFKLSQFRLTGCDADWIITPQGCWQGKLDGLKGPKGIKGPKAQPGPRGPPGEKGPLGGSGEKGPQGPQGPQGPPGDDKPMAPDGNKGPKGEEGDIGKDGEQGPRGPPGPMGPQGPGSFTLKGTPGQPGEPGQPGDSGPKGIKGNEGPGGDRGDTGDNGPQGPGGPGGIKGFTGPQGPGGPGGIKGPKGEPGPDGDNGPQGEQGQKGFKGGRGPAGPTGPSETGPVGESTVLICTTANYLFLFRNPQYISNFNPQISGSETEHILYGNYDVNYQAVSPEGSTINPSENPVNPSLASPACYPRCGRVFFTGYGFWNPASESGTAASTLSLTGLNDYYWILPNVEQDGTPLTGPPSPDNAEQKRTRQNEERQWDCPRPRYTVGWTTSFIPRSTGDLDNTNNRCMAHVRVDVQGKVFAKRIGVCNPNFASGNFDFFTHLDFSSFSYSIIDFTPQTGNVDLDVNETENPLFYTYFFRGFGFPEERDNDGNPLIFETHRVQKN